MTQLSFSNAGFSDAPFPHLRIPSILSQNHANTLLNWLSLKAPWKLRVEDFYEQDEFSFLSGNLGEEVRTLVEPSTVDFVRRELRKAFSLSEDLTLVDINAHRLTPGQTIRIHNDFIEGQETHRLLIQLNNGWSQENGGLLMLFHGAAAEDVSNIILPRHGTGFAFEISPRSFHAVSKINNGERYTIVYSFKGAS
jgi:Rps23 Pro-64 3,4-dihydroxylase Tpa1-like proline 4-hydroxylase